MFRATEFKTSLTLSTLCLFNAYVAFMELQHKAKQNWENLDLNITCVEILWGKPCLLDMGCFQQQIKNKVFLNPANMRTKHLLYSSLRKYNSYLKKSKTEISKKISVSESQELIIGGGPVMVLCFSLEFWCHLTGRVFFLHFSYPYSTHLFVCIYGNHFCMECFW